MGDWRQHKLADLGRIVTGKTPPTSNPDFYGGEIPFVTPSDMDGRRTIDHTARCLTELGAEKVRSSYIKEAAVVVSCIGSDMGKAALVNHSFVSNQQINSVVVSNDFDRLFVYYNLSARKDEIRYKASGAAQPIMNKSDFGNLILSAPNLGLQRAISGILGTLDDKIEMNRRMNETLEAMSRAIFRDWFVDFGPILAKAEGRPPYLAPDLWNLFPDALDGEDKPVGWKKVKIGDICERVFSGGTPKTNEPAYWDGNVPWLSSGETRSKFIIETEKTITEAGVINSSAREARKGATVIASAGQGKTRGQTSFLAFDSFINQSVVALEANRNAISDEFLLLDLERRYEELRAISDSHSSRGSLTTRLLAGLSCVLPNPVVHAAFQRSVEPMIKKMGDNARNSKSLRQTRNLLLPKLMSGEIRLREAETAVEAVA